MHEVKDFIYLDMEKVSSLYSQLTGGIIQQCEESTSTSVNNKKVRNLDFKILKHEAGKTDSEIQSVKETRISHHDIYNELENSLFEQGYTAEIGVDVTKEQIVSGDATRIFENTLCVKAKGWGVLEDHERLSGIADKYNDIVKFVDRSSATSLKVSPEYCDLLQKIEILKIEIKSAIKGRNKNKKKHDLIGLQKLLTTMTQNKQMSGVEDWIIEGIRNWIRVFLPSIFNFRLYPFEELDNFHILSNLKRDSFVDNDTEAVHFLYGSKPSVKISMLGIITSIPHEDGQLFNPMREFIKKDWDKERNDAASFEKAFRGVFRGFDSFEEIIRTCRYPRIMVQPIAIYRSIKPNKALQRTSC